MEEILKGTNGKIIAYEDRIIISRKTFGGFANFGIVPDRTIYYNSIQAVDLSLTSIRLILVGDSVKQYKQFSIAQTRLEQKDVNTVTFLSPKNRKIANKICNFINQKINK